jgi:hypothetical protein
MVWAPGCEGSHAHTHTHRHTETQSGCGSLTRATHKSNQHKHRHRHGHRHRHRQTHIQNVYLEPHHGQTHTQTRHTHTPTPTPTTPTVLVVYVRYIPQSTNAFRPNCQRTECTNVHGCFVRCPRSQTLHILTPLVISGLVVPRSIRLGHSHPPLGRSSPVERSPIGRPMGGSTPWSKKRFCQPRCCQLSTMSTGTIVAKLTPRLCLAAFS